MNKKDLEKLSEDELRQLAHHVLDLETLTKHCDPFVGCWVELEYPITKQEVLNCIEKGEAQLVETPIWTELAFKNKDWTEAEVRQNHIKKIAYFATHEIETPICIDVGIPSLGCYVSHIVDDGNHRLAGAIIKGDKTIKSHVMGSLNYAQELGLSNPNIYEQFLFDKMERDRQTTIKQNSIIKSPAIPTPVKKLKM
jgi:hypothetical protein